MLITYDARLQYPRRCTHGHGELYDMRALLAECQQAVYCAVQTVCREGEAPVRRMETHFEVIGLVHMLLTLGGWSETCGVTLGL